MGDSQYDVAIVGAGFAGMYMLHRCLEMGMSARVYEGGSGVGGTWFWNRYPGARCDIPSMEYSYQFSDALQQEWRWSEKYATQPEILKYANHVAERFNLFPHIQFNTRVQAAHYDAASQLWSVSLEDGERCNARFVVMATGCLSVPNYPSIDGLDSFNGPVYHTGHWPQEGVDFTDQRVAVIGTGSSAIQSIPLIAEQAQSVHVFQRTPNYSVPAHNAPLDDDYVESVKANYADYRAANYERGFGADFDDNELATTDVTPEEREAEFERRWEKGGLAFLAAFSDLVFDDDANGTARDFIAAKIAQEVNDPDLAQKLTPTTPVGCKRLCVDDGYYATFNQPHVHLVDLRDEALEGVDANGVVTAKGRYAADALVLATGFDAMTGAVSRIDVRGRDGVTLKDKWADGPRAYLGLATAGFPNLFLITGPGSPSVLSNMLPSIEQHVNWVAECLQYMQDHQFTEIDAEGAAEDAWVDHVIDVAETSVYPHCNSWYLGANVEGKKRIFMPYLGVPPYIEKCNDVVAKGYDGFALSATASEA